MTDQPTIEQQAQAALYELLALSFAYPKKELAQALVGGEYIDTVHELAEILSIVLPEDFDNNFMTYQQAEEKDVVHALRIEHTRLFIGSPEPVISPYEGVWRAHDEGVQALMFVNPHSIAVEKFYKEYGIVKPQDANEPLDHISAELEFLQFLTAVSAGMMRASTGADKTPEEHLKGLEQFKEEHVCVWMPRFADDIIGESREPFFIGAAQILKASL